MKKAVSIFIVVVLMLVSACSFLFYKASNDTYMKERTYACKVLSKIDNQYETHIKEITHHNRNFTLVLSSEGKDFSLDVNPTTWAMCKIGDTLFLTIAPYQLDYYQSIPAMRWGFWAFVCTLVSVAIIWILAVILLAIVKIHYETTRGIL